MHSDIDIDIFVERVVRATERRRLPRVRLEFSRTEADS